MKAVHKKRKVAFYCYTLYLVFLNWGKRAREGESRNVDREKKGV